MRALVPCTWFSAVLVATAASAPTLAADAPDPTRQAELRHLLSQDCGSCHGLTLAGGLGPALTYDALSGKPRELLRVTILKGRPGTAMPPWEGLLSPSDVDYLVDQLTESRP